MTPLFADATAFAELVADLARPFAAEPLDAVAGIDALGFVLGGALALHLHTGFIAIRKGGKLPVASDRVAFVDYTDQEKVLELRRGAVLPGARVLVVDEWIETGAQVRAATQLIEGQGGRVAAIATIHLDDTPGTRWLRARYPCHAVRCDF